MQLRSWLQLQPAQMNQHQQHDSPCCVLKTSATSRNKPVQNRIKFAVIQTGLTTPARPILSKAIPPRRRVNRENRVLPRFGCILTLFLISWV